MTNYQQAEAAAQLAGFKSYADYLFSDHWQSLKLHKNVRHCCACGGSRNLLPHHIRYRNLIDVQLEDLAGMCMECHDDFHIACRRMKLDYSRIEEPEIGTVVRQFRLSPYYGKRVTKLKRRKALRADRDRQSATGRYRIEAQWPARSERDECRLDSLVATLRKAKSALKHGAACVTIYDTTI